MGILATTLLLGACGGGEDPFGISGGPASSSLLPITSANGVEAARLSYEAALSSSSFADLGTLPVASGGSGGGAQIAVMAASPEDIVLEDVVTPDPAIWII